jgi:hypothetical protein
MQVGCVLHIEAACASNMHTNGNSLLIAHFTQHYDTHFRYVCLNPTYASTAAGTVSFEVVLSACGAVQISYPGNFTAPRSGKYTVGFSAQYNNMSDAVCESSAAAQQCEKWYSISSGAALLMNPVTAPCVTLDATAAGVTAAAAAAVQYLALDAFSSGVGTAFTCMVANPEYLGDGFCDDEAYNTAACGYDGGKCKATFVVAVSMLVFV